MNRLKHPMAAAELCAFFLTKILPYMEEPTTLPVKERKVKGRVVIDIEKCKGCELCTVACKEHALRLSDTINIKGYRYIVANNDVCTGCVNCALVCPDAVITVYRTHPKKQPVNITPPNIKEELKNALAPVPGNANLS